MLSHTPKGHELNVPYQIYFLEDKIKNWDCRDRYSIIPKKKLEQNKQLNFFDM
ncbi:hypothetical protein FACS189459_6670 [Bacilli bacterium]|nr:hypothetical protein FACS189459_6670 [Bacilli bacterium]